MKMTVSALIDRSTCLVRPTQQLIARMQYVSVVAVVDDEEAHRLLDEIVLVEPCSSDGNVQTHPNRVRFVSAMLVAAEIVLVAAVVVDDGEAHRHPDEIVSVEPC